MDLRDQAFLASLPRPELICWGRFEYQHHNVYAEKKHTQEEHLGPKHGVHLSLEH
jgi:hypothetical protein